MKKLLKGLLLLTAALTVIVFTALYNPTLFKGPIERYLGKATGYTVILGGDLEIDTGRLTRITAENLRISAPAWANRPNLVKVDYMVFSLETASLLKDTLVLDTLRLDGLQVNLETGADGRNNWRAANLTESPTAADRAAPVVIFNDVKLKQAIVRYKNGTRDIEHLLDLTSVSQQQENGMLNVVLDGTFNNRPVQYKGSMGPYLNLLEGKDIGFTAKGHFGTLNVNGEGWLDDLVNPKRPRFNFELDGPDIDEITSMLGFDDLGSGGFFIHARGEEVGDHYEADINGKIGDIDLAVTVQASDLFEADELDLALNADGPRLGALMRSLGVAGWPDTPFSVKSDIRRVGQTLDVSSLTVNIGNAELALDALLTNFPKLDASRLRLSVGGDDAAQFRELLNLPGVAGGPFEMWARLDVSAQGEELIQAELKTSLGHLVASGTLGAGPGYNGSKVHLLVDGSNAQAVLSILEIDALPESPFALDVHVETTTDGLTLERGSLLTIEDKRLEFDGVLSFDPDGVGTDMEMDFSGDDISGLDQFLAIGDAPDIFVPGQPYRASGRIRISAQGLKLDGIKGRIGTTQLDVDGLVGNLSGLSGSKLGFSMAGPDLDAFLANRDDSTLPIGAFEFKGQLLISDDTLHIRQFAFDADRINGMVDLRFGWPFDASPDVVFDVDIEGEDIRQLLPSTSLFEVNKAGYRFDIAGQKQDHRISFEQFDATVGGLTISSKGRAGDDAKHKNVEITFSAVADNLATLGTVNGKDLPALPLDLKADFNGDMKQFTLNGFSGRLGNSDISGILEIFLLNSKPEIRLEAKSRLIDLHPFQRTDDKGEVGTPAESQRVIPDIRLPLDILSMADLTFNLNIDELQYGNDVFRNLAVEAGVQSGRLDIPQLSFYDGRGKLEATLSVHSINTSLADFKIDVVADDIVFGPFSGWNKSNSQTPAFDVNFKADGKGGSLRELAGSMNGSLYVGSTGGSVKGIDLSVLNTFFLEEVLSLVMPNRNQDEPLNLTCAAAALDISNGFVRTNPAVAFTTDRIKIVSEGTLDLKTEKIQFSFNTIPNNALKISTTELINPFILVRGTLSNPVIGLDPAKALLHSGAAIGTAGISILAKGFLDRLGATQPSCKEMLKQRPDKP